MSAFVKRLPLALWQLVTHAIFLVVASVCAAVLPPPLLVLRCVAKSWEAMTASHARDAKGGWEKSAVVIVGADTTTGAGLVQYFADCGAAHIVAAGTDTVQLHTACEALPRAKPLRMHGTTADADRIADIVRSSGDALAVVVFCTPERRPSNALGVSTATSITAAIADKLAPLLQASAVRAREGVHAAPCGVRMVVVDVVPDLSAAGTAFCGVAQAALDGLDSSTALVSIRRVSVPSDLLVQIASAAEAAAATAEGSPRRVSAESHARKALGEATGDVVVSTSARLHSTAVASPIKKALREMRVAAWTRVAVPSSFGLKESVLAALSLPTSAD
jgi:hypothetical protein